MLNGKEKIVKRTISIRNNALVSALVSDDAEANNKTESAVFEDALIAHFFGENEQSNYLVVKNINDDSFVKLTLKDICDYYSAMSQEVNDSQLKIVDYMYNIELTNRTIIKGNEKIIPKFKTDLQYFINELQKYTYNENGKYICREFKTPDGKIAHVDEYTLINLNDTCKYIDTNPDMINSGPDIALIIQDIRWFWNLGKNGKSSLKNWRIIWKLLSDICVLSNWPEIAKYRNELVLLLKELKKEDSELYNDKTPALNRIIYMKNKAIITTENAIIVKEDDKLSENDFQYAKRLIHGFNGKPYTDKPIIFLYNNDDANVAGTIAQQKAPKSEFDSENDVYAVPILSEEKYYDDRIKWFIV